MLNARKAVIITHPHKPSADHILYGSDYPYVAAPALVSARESLQKRLPALGLDPEAILSDNAWRLFGSDIPVREYGERIVRLAEIEVVPEKLENQSQEVKTGPDFRNLPLRSSSFPSRTR